MADVEIDSSEAGLTQQASDATSSIFDAVLNGRWADFSSHLSSTVLSQSVLMGLTKAAIGLAVVFVGYFAAKYLSRVVSQPVRKRVDETLGKFVGKMVFYLVLFGVSGAVLSSLGAPLGGLAALLAAAGFAIGLAFQGTLSNFAAGVLMLVFRPFKVGDVINAAGVTGKVDEIDLFTTTLDTPDNRRIIVPNSSISGGTIENVSFHQHRRIEVAVGVDYSADQDAVRGALQQAVDTFQTQTIHGEGRGTAVILNSLGDSAVDWKIRMWVNSADYWALTESLTGEIKRQLDAVSIGIPFPQMDVHINRVDAAEDVVQQRPRVRPTRRDPVSIHRDDRSSYAS